jgi:hypothetical protein
MVGPAVLCAAFLATSLAPRAARAAEAEPDDQTPAAEETSETSGEVAGPTESTAESPTDDRAASSDLLGGERKEHVRIGVIAGAAFPRPLSVEAMIKIERTFSIGLEYSAMPQTKLGDAVFGWHAWAVDARLFPLQGAFFMGMRVARQHLDGSASVSAGSYGSYSGAIATDTWYVEPRLGFLWTFRSGITVGLDAGLEIPLSHTNTAALPAGVAVPTEVATIRDLFGASKLPTVTLLTVGALF